MRLQKSWRPLVKQAFDKNLFELKEKVIQVEFNQFTGTLHILTD